MSGGLDRAGERLAQYLREQGVNAVTAWPVTQRKPLEQPVAAVSLRGVQAQPAGFQHYLGLRYDQEADRWEELYGRKARLTFGLDLYARPESGEAGLTGGPGGTHLRLRRGRARGVIHYGIFLRRDRLRPGQPPAEAAGPGGMRRISIRRPARGRGIFGL